MSRENDEQQKRLEFQRFSAAKGLGLPADFPRNDPEFSESLDAYAGFAKLQAELTEAMADMDRPVVGGSWQPPYDPIDDVVPERGEMIEVSPILKRQIQTNYRRTLSLTEAALAIMKEQLQIGKADPNYIRERITASVDGLGLSVVEGSASDMVKRELDALERQQADENLIYFGGMTRYDLIIKDIDEKGEAYFQRTNNRRDYECQIEPELRMPVVFGAQKKGYGDLYPLGGWRYAPQIYTFAKTMSTSELLAINHIDEGTIDRFWPAGIDNERRAGATYKKKRKISTLADVTWELMREGTYPTPYTSSLLLESLAHRVSYILDDYGFHIE